MPSKAGPTCCGVGGSWEGNCGRKNDKSVDHTWTDGMKVCVKAGAAQKVSGFMQEEQEPDFSEVNDRAAVDMGSVVETATSLTSLIGLMYCFTCLFI